MGNFLVIISSDRFQQEAKSLFCLGLEAARFLKYQIPNGTVQAEWVHAASFPRRNGSGTPIVIDRRTGSWLLTIGTWFHTDDYGSGAESRLLSRYLEVGPLRLAREIEGFFVVVIGDGNTKETIVITDLFGSCHCFMRTWGQAVGLSGSSLLLAALDDVNLDPVGCQEFLCSGTIYENRTLYQEVKKLGPATVFRFADGTAKTNQRYWQITDIVPESLDGPHAVRALWETLTHTAKRVEQIFERPVCDLTGGYDSRALVAAFLGSGTSFSTTVSGPAESPDVVVSKGLAELEGLNHLYIEPEGQTSFEEVKEALPFTDGEFDLIEYARILQIHRILSKRFDISINGSYGGVARAWRWELLFPWIGARHKLDALKLAELRYAPRIFDSSIFPEDIRLDFVSHFTNLIERINVGLSKLPNTIQMDNANLSMRIHRWQGRVASSTNQLWPCLSPFGLRSVLETVLQTKANLRLRSLLVRQMLAKYQPRVAQFPLDRGYPASPVTWNNFYRFWPLPVHFAERILSKVIPRSKSPRPPLRLQLWQNEEVQQLLSPKEMKVVSLADTSAMGNFLKLSMEQNFLFDDQWARVLTLEYTFHVLENGRFRAVHGRSQKL